MIGTLKRCLQVVITEGRDIRYGIIPPLKRHSLHIAGKRRPGYIEDAGGTISGQPNLFSREGYGFAKKTRINKLIP